MLTKACTYKHTHALTPAHTHTWIELYSLLEAIIAPCSENKVDNSNKFLHNKQVTNYLK